VRDSCNRSTMTRFSSSINTLMLSHRLHIEGMRHGRGSSGAMRMSHEANIGGAARIDVVRIDQQLPRCERHQARVDVHGLATAGLEQGDCGTCRPRCVRSQWMPDSFVTLLRMPNRSRPQRTKSAASKTGSYSFTT